MAVRGTRVNVTDQPTALNADDSGDPIPGKRITVSNTSASALDLGGPTVVSGSGFQLAVGDVYSTDLDHGETLYAIGPSAGPFVVQVLQGGVA